MKRKKKIIITVVLTTSILVLLAMVLSYKENSGHKCRTCHSYRQYSKCAIGGHTGLSVTIWSREIIAETTIYKILFTKDHKHDWELVHRESYSIFIRRYASGTAGRSDFVIYYEEVPPFREFINKKIAEGKLTRDQLYQMLALSAKVFEGEDTDAHTSKLVHMAKQLVIEGDKQL
jgi:hypothetical protein